MTMTLLNSDEVVLLDGDGRVDGGVPLRLHGGCAVIVAQRLAPGDATYDDLRPRLEAAQRPSREHLDLVTSGAVISLTRAKDLNPIHTRTLNLVN